MRIIKVGIEKQDINYPIIIGRNILSKLYDYILKLNLGETTYIITNSFLRKYYDAILRKSFKDIKIKYRIVPDNEKTKSLKIVVEILRELVNYSKKKNVFLTAFGGGVVGDLTGFVASIYKRGVPYINLPTTLLAQVDSSIGGKTALDLPEAKNIIGTFYQPRIVFSEVSFLKSLSIEEIRNGLAEVIKYGLIKDERLFYFVEKNYLKILNKDLSVLEYIIKKSSYIKAKIVEEDEREEKGIRTILNFGHTFGHALESAGNYQKYTHGQAISLGMILEAELSKNLGLLKTETKTRIEKLILKIGLPTRIKNLTLQKIIDAYYYDKKFKGQKNRFVLIKDIAQPIIIEDIPLSVIKRTLKTYLETT